MKRRAPPEGAKMRRALSRVSVAIFTTSQSVQKCDANSPKSASLIVGTGELTTLFGKLRRVGDTTKIGASGRGRRAKIGEVGAERRALWGGR